MKIGIDAYPAFFQEGGIARYARALINAMIREKDPLPDLVLFYNRFREHLTAWKPDNDELSIRQWVFPRRWVNGLWNQFGWPPIERWCGPIDLFHGLHFVLPPAREALRVLTVHDLTYLKYPDYFSDRRLNERGYRQELPRALERADEVIAVSEQTRDDLVQLMHFPQERIRVIHEGVDPAFFMPADPHLAARVQQRYGLKTPYIVFLVGTPEPRKNLDRAVAAVKKADPHIQLALVGPTEKLQRLISEENRNVVFTGSISDHHLAALLSGAAVSLYPSLYEGFGLPVLESMACGAPVITSDRGSLPEVAGEAALIVDPENTSQITDAIVAALQNESLRHRLAECGRARAARFTWEKTARETLALYRELT